MLCIIGFDDNKYIKDFIRLHVESLPFDRIHLGGQFPDYTYHNQNIRKQYQQNLLMRKVHGLLPYAYTSRVRAHLANSNTSIQNSLKTFFIKHGIDVFLAEFGDTGADIAPLALDLDIPLVVHFHGHDAHRKSLLTPSMLARYKIMFESAGVILVVSRLMYKVLLDLGCPAQKLVYNPYGPRQTFFDVQPDYRPTVLSVGRFTDIKANYLNILAFQKVLKSIPDARLALVGNGELLETCKTLSTALALDAKIDFHGAIEHSKIPSFFARACCFAQHSVTPTYGDAEGTPNTILEASAASLPIVATRHAGILDVVVEGKTGFLVDERDIDGMAESMQKLLEDPVLCRTMGEHARERVRCHFTSSSHIHRLSKAIEFARQRDAARIAELAEDCQQIGMR